VPVQPGETHAHPQNGCLAPNRPITRQTNLLQAVRVELCRRAEDDVKLLPETCGVEGGAGGRELSAPMARVETVALARIDPVPLPRVEPVLRLVNAASAVAVEPQPIRLTAVADAAPWAGPADERWTGAALRRAREARGLTLPQMADRTKITRHHIENIEGDRFDLLPSYVYLRGILLSLAKELQLDSTRVCRSYLDLAREATEA
jgi:hypothetical protein